MGLQKLYSEEHEAKKASENELKEQYKNIDKGSTKTADLVKKIEAIEKILGLES